MFISSSLCIRLYVAVTFIGCIICNGLVCYVYMSVVDRVVIEL